jgi:hypothetical protein
MNDIILYQDFKVLNALNPIATSYGCVLHFKKLCC